MPAPAKSGLSASKQRLADLLSPAYWQGLCPPLHVGGADPPPPLIRLPAGRVKDLRGQMDGAAVAQVSPPELTWRVDMADMAAAVTTLLEHGWPATFLLVYDELWAMVHQAGGLMQAVTGNACNMDILAWHVDPSKGQAGFSPHRDRQPDDASATFRADGSPRYATLWVPFVDATPENSCLYCIPRYADPGYLGDDDSEDSPSPLEVALPNKEAYQHVRALPTQAGGAVMFTHRIIHWGSQGRPGCAAPRINMSFGCADDAYEAPYLPRAHLPHPPLPLRLALIGAQLIIYYQRIDLDARMLALCHEAFMAHVDEFDPTYRRKVLAEFVAATKEVTAGGGGRKRPQPAAPAAKPAPGAGAGGAAGGRGRGKGAANGAAAGRQASQGKPAKKVKASKRKDAAEEEEDEEEEEGGPDLVQMLGVGAGAADEDSEDYVWERAMDAMLDAELAAGGGRCSEGGGGGFAFEDDFEGSEEDGGRGGGAAHAAAGGARLPGSGKGAGAGKGGDKGKGKGRGAAGAAGGKAGSSRKAHAAAAGTKQSSKKRQRGGG